ncbi:hypothetical protein ACFOGJ_22270 [Marinibaculum pumilum]|uniref:Uncharacterized protein n=1 Tax=Marinibaculum pumilum TaxID=1766165 RepID=A0ABV7L6L0_9PROT
MRAGPTEAVLNCGVFELAAEGRGAPVFPEAGPYGMDPVGVLPMPQGGTRAITYVAQRPQPHFKGAEWRPRRRRKPKRRGAVTFHRHPCHDGGTVRQSAVTGRPTGRVR